ncbi:hypothetical protein CPB84DRAFT_1691417, partial [Gymnopilus junonius]
MEFEHTISEFPLPHLIFSNLLPSLNEKQVTQTVIGTLNSQLHSLDAEIADLANLLDEKKRKRVVFHDALRKHQAILHPVRTLPPEILSRIFLHCLPENLFFENILHRPTRSEAPLLLVQICRSWRTVALQTPPLW